MPAPLNRWSLQTVSIIDAAGPPKNVVEIPYIVDVGTWVPTHRVPFLHRDTDGSFADLAASLGAPQPGQLQFTSKDVAYWNSTGLVDVSPWEIATYGTQFTSNTTPVVGTTCEDQRPLYSIALGWKDCDNAGAIKYELYDKAYWSAEGGKSVGEEGNLINWQVTLLGEPTYVDDLNP